MTSSNGPIARGRATKVYIAALLLSCADLFLACAECSPWKQKSDPSEDIRPLSDPPQLSVQTTVTWKDVDRVCFSVGQLSLRLQALEEDNKSMREALEKQRSDLSADSTEHGNFKEQIANLQAGEKAIAEENAQMKKTMFQLLSQLLSVDKDLKELSESNARFEMRLSDAELFKNAGTEEPLFDDGGFYVSRLDGYSYKRIEVPVATPSEAKAKCETIGASLPVFHPNSARYRVLRRLLKPGEAIYVGINRAAPAEDHVFSATSEAGPRSDAINGEAAIMRFNGSWEDAAATTPANLLVCSRWSGYEPKENGKFYRVSTTQVNNWWEAKAACLAEGGRLAIPYGQQAMKILGDYRRGPDKSNFYVDGHKLADGSYSWQFQDGTSFDERFRPSDPARTFAWFPRNPERSPGENCLLMCTEAGQLCDAFCTDQVGYACERDF